MPELRYVCQRCGDCCRWPGFVNVSESEIAEIARFLAVPEQEFINTQTRLRPDRDGLALLDKPDGSCAFLTTDGACEIQCAKPSQCRAFPNGWNFPGWRDLCQAKDTHPNQCP